MFVTLSVSEDMCMQVEGGGGIVRVRDGCVCALVCVCVHACASVAGFLRWLVHGRACCLYESPEATLS